VDPENAAPRLLEFQRLIPDSVGIAMRAADPADFLGWVRERLLNYAAPDSPLHGDTNLGRAMAFAWARAVWNGLAHVSLLFQQQLGGGNRTGAMATANRLLQLNPADDHRVGSALEHLSHS
jgi:hypothetical protein